MTTDLVPVENTATLEAMSPADREVAVTHMLTEARAWLAHAKEATGPAEIANFKAHMATVAEATKQLNLSKEIQLDAQEMVRRAERGVGVAIRERQEQGDLPSRRNHPFMGNQHVAAEVPEAKSSTKDFFRNGTDQTMTYVMADATEEEFEAAIAEAKSEGNMARANVARKVKQSRDPSRSAKAETIEELASQGYASRQMVDRIGIAEDTIRSIAREFSIEIPADKALGKATRVDSTDVVRNIVTSYENAPAAESAVNWSEVNPAEADEWVDSLIASIGAARAFIRKINKLKESTHV